VGMCVEPTKVVCSMCSDAKRTDGIGVDFTDIVRQGGGL